MVLKEEGFAYPSTLPNELVSLPYYQNYEFTRDELGKVLKAIETKLLRQENQFILDDPLEDEPVRIGGGVHFFIRTTTTENRSSGRPRPKFAWSAATSMERRPSGPGRSGNSKARYIREKGSLGFTTRKASSTMVSALSFWK